MPPLSVTLDELDRICWPWKPASWKSLSGESHQVGRWHASPPHEARIRRSSPVHVHTGRMQPFQGCRDNGADPSQGSSKTRNPGLDAEILLGLSELHVLVPVGLKELRQQSGRDCEDSSLPSAGSEVFKRCDDIGQSRPNQSHGDCIFQPSVAARAATLGTRVRQKRGNPERVASIAPIERSRVHVQTKRFYCADDRLPCGEAPIGMPVGRGRAATA